MARTYSDAAVCRSLRISQPTLRKYIAQGFKAPPLRLSRPGGSRLFRHWTCADVGRLRDFVARHYHKHTALKVTPARSLRQNMLLSTRVDRIARRLGAHCRRLYGDAATPDLLAKLTAEILRSVSPSAVAELQAGLGRAGFSVSEREAAIMLESRLAEALLPAFRKALVRSGAAAGLVN